MAILHAHVPSFVSASHRLALHLYSIVGLSITSPGSHVPQHRWSQHHVSRLALMLALMCLAVAIHSLSHIHALRKRSTVCQLKAQSTVCSRQSMDGPDPRFAQNIYIVRLSVNALPSRSNSLDSLIFHNR